MNDIKKLIIPVMLIFLFCNGCSKIDDLTNPFTKGGEIIYATRLDSLKAFSGNNRLKLTWLLPANNSAVKAIAYWDNKAKSREIPLVKRLDNTYEHIMDDMPEASYLFDVYTYDKENHISIKSSVSVVTYGEVYRKNLLNRLYIKLSKKNGKLLINWNNPDQDMTHMEIQYTNTSNTVVSEIIPTSSNETIIAGDVDFSKAMKYRTVYNPGLKSIDTFTSEWTNNIDISSI